MIFTGGLFQFSKCQNSFVAKNSRGLSPFFPAQFQCLILEHHYKTTRKKHHLNSKKPRHHQAFSNQRPYFDIFCMLNPPWSFIINSYLPSQSSQSSPVIPSHPPPAPATARRSAARCPRCPAPPGTRWSTASASPAGGGRLAAVQGMGGAAMGWNTAGKWRWNMWWNMWWNRWWIYMVNCQAKWMWILSQCGARIRYITLNDFGRECFWAGKCSGYIFQLSSKPI